MIRLAEPWLMGNESAYVLDALRQNQLSMGNYVARFEAAFAAAMGCEHGISTTSGTTALHLILAAIGIGPGDEVILPALTFVATANAVRYCGATPVLADISPETWCINPDDVAQRITSRTRAIIAVHLYGHPADMDSLQELADGYELRLIEDAAEAPGAFYKGRPVGALSEAAAFSFYGNKTITTGEGGMVTTHDKRLAERLRLLRGQGMDPTRRYWHAVVGYNYRMTELQGAVGLGQVEELQVHLAARRRVAELYRQFAPDLRWQGTATWARPAWWMNVAQFEDRDGAAERLAKRGIETRPAFVPLHLMPPYHDCGIPGAYPVAERVGACGLCLPSHARMAADDVWQVCETLRNW
jgi:perosamine synthetase